MAGKIPFPRNQRKKKRSLHKRVLVCVETRGYLRAAHLFLCPRPTDFRVFVCKNRRAPVLFFFITLSLSAVNDSGVPPLRLGLQQRLEETDLSPLSVATPNARGRVKERGRREGERNSTTVSRIQHTNTHTCRAEFELGGKYVITFSACGGDVHRCISCLFK